MGIHNKIIVTGGTGFIGSHTVVELINAGYEPVVIDNFSNSKEWIIDRINTLTGKKVTLYQADCRDIKAMRNIFKNEDNIGGIIHFAAFKYVGESVRDPLKYYDNNLNSLMVMLKMCKDFNISKMVFSSSCTVYGEADDLPVTELSPIKKAESPYGFTKQIGEQIIWDAMPNGAILLRYFNPIGAHPSGLIGELPNGMPENLVPFITQTAAGLRDKLWVFGNDYDTPDGTCIRDYIHVVDLANAHVAALKRLEMNTTTDIFNIGTGKGNSVLEAINEFESINNLKLNYEITARRPGDVEQIYADTTKARNLLQWFPIYTLTDSLKHAWQWEKGLMEQKNN